MLLPAGLGEICSHSFAECEGARLVIPASVKRIGHYAFVRGRIKDVVLQEESELWWCFATIYVLPGMEFDIEDHADGRTVVRLPPLDVRVGKATRRSSGIPGR